MGTLFEGNKLKDNKSDRQQCFHWVQFLILKTWKHSKYLTIEKITVLIIHSVFYNITIHHIAF
jgi:hypothetical protein